MTSAYERHRPTGKSSSQVSLRDFLYICRLTVTGVPNNFLISYSYLLSLLIETELTLSEWTVIGQTDRKIRVGHMGQRSILVTYWCNYCHYVDAVSFCCSDRGVFTRSLVYWVIGHGSRESLASYSVSQMIYCQLCFKMARMISLAG